MKKPIAGQRCDRLEDYQMVPREAVGESGNHADSCYMSILNMKVSIELNEQERAKIYAVFNAALREILPVDGEFTIAESNIQFLPDKLNYARLVLECSPKAQPQPEDQVPGSDLESIRQRQN